MALTSEQIMLGILKEQRFGVEDAMQAIAWAIEHEIEVTVAASSCPDEVLKDKVTRVEIRVPRERW